MIVIVDCMGGDKAPLEVVKGAYAASLEYNANFILVGDIVDQTSQTCT